MKVFSDVNSFMSSNKMYVRIFLISFFSYMFFNQAMPITDPVESNYALTAKEMVLTGDWISPRIYGNVWFDKPVFFYWLTALSFKFFGFSAWAARLGPAFFAAVGLVLLYWFTSKIASRKTAILSVIIMGTSFEYMILAKLIITDMVFFLFNCAALGFFYLGYVRMDGCKWWYLAAYVSMAFAVLTKGPIGVLLPGLVILVFIATQRNWAEFKAIFWPTGVFLFAVVALPWYVTMYALHGTAFIDTFFGVHNYLRATVSEHPKDNVSYYYFVVFVISLLPWSALAIKSLIQGGKKLIHQTSPLYVFFFVWIAAYFGFYSLMATKYLTYTFPILFPIAILTAVHLEQILKSERVATICYWIGIPVLLLGVVYVFAAYRYLSGSNFQLVAISLLAFLVFSMWKSRKKTANDIFKWICFLQLGIYSILCVFIFPVIAENRSGKKIAESMIYLGAEKIGMYQFYSTSAVFYSDEIAVKLTSSEVVDSAQSRELDWSSKYTMPIQELTDFGEQWQSSNRLIIVPDKQRKNFLLHADPYRYQLIKRIEGVSYYAIIK